MMRGSIWQKAAGALAVSLLGAGTAQAQDFGDAHPVTGHTFRPQQEPATDERVRSLQVPDGFEVQVVARDLGHLRMLAVTDDGTILATRYEENDVIALEDKDGDGRGDGEPRTVASDLAGVHGIALREGEVWLATIHEIYRGEWQGGEIANLEPIVESLPDGGQHPRRPLIWSVQALAKAGTLSIIGVYPQTDRFFPIGMAMNRNITVRMGNCNHRKYIPELVDLVRRGSLDPARVLTQREPVTSAIEAYKVFDRRRPGWIKVELLPQAA